MNRADDRLDLDAMRQLRDGDEAALNLIIERWTPRIALFLTRFLGSVHDAEDLTQETFVAVYRARDRFQPSAPFSTWLFGIAANLARQRLRWRARHPETHAPLDHETEPDASTPDTPHDALHRAERAAAVRAAVLNLPPDLREAVLLAEFEGLSHQQIASIARCSAKAIESRLYRARKHLRDILAPWL